MFLPVRLRRPACALACAAGLVLPMAAAAPAAAGSDQLRVAEVGGPVGGPKMGVKGTVAGGARGVPAFPAGISASSFVLADLTTGEVLAARNPHGRYLPASTLKMLTAVALIPELDPKAVHVARWENANIEGSKVGIVPGERYTVDKLFEAMLVVSGNDAAHGLASAAGGPHRAAELLNATATRLQAYDTKAVNTSGLDAPGQLTSAYDLALITREGMRMPSFARYVRTLRSSMNAPGGRRFEIFNHNKLLTRYPGTDGGKTGYTIAARHCYVATAKRGNRHLVVAMLKAETRYPDAMRLLDWGFAAAGRVPPVGRLVEPLYAAPPARHAVEQADRSRTEDAAAAVAPSEAPAVIAPPRRDGGRLPVPPLVAVGAGGLGTAGLVLRRRRNRRRYGGSRLRLDLPVR